MGLRVPVLITPNVASSIGLGRGVLNYAVNFKSSFLKLAMQWHPDRHPENKAAAERRFKEVNEAFSAQMVALIKEIPLDLARLNIHGGAVALGHPIGASGTRILVDLIYEMKRRGVQKGRVLLNGVGPPPCGGHLV